MKKILATAFIFTSLITTAEAAQQADNGIVVGVDYTYFTISPYYGDANPGAINASIGYKFNLTNNFSLTPEYKIGTGLTDDSTRRVVSVFASVDGVLYEFEDIDVEIDNFMLFSLRAQYELDNGIYFYIAPSYARTKISLSGFSAPTIGLREASQLQYDTLSNKKIRRSVLLPPYLL